MSPETEARAALKALLVAEFGGAPDNLTVVDDKLYASLGDKGTRIGTSPVVSKPQSRNSNVLEMQILVQFYGRWRKDVNPEQVVDPSIIEGYADRFRNRLRTGDPNTNSVWFFRLDMLSYPDDPTGNKTRFEATVTAVGNNSALLETLV